MSCNQLVGVWKLQQWTVKGLDQQIHHPYGKDAQGYLIYTACGFMSAHLMKNDIPTIQSESIFNVTAEEAYHLIRSYVSYCGPYSIDSARSVVVHHIEMMSVPNWIGQSEERHFDVSGDTLTIKAVLQMEHEEKHTEVIWQRQSPRAT